MPDAGRSTSDRPGELSRAARRPTARAGSFSPHSFRARHITSSIDRPSAPSGHAAPQRVHGQAWRNADLGDILIRKPEMAK